MSVRNEVKQEAPEAASETLTMPEKKYHGKKSKKSFICKPSVIHFKVPLCFKTHPNKCKHISAKLAPLSFT